MLRTFLLFVVFASTAAIGAQEATDVQNAIPFLVKFSGSLQTKTSPHLVGMTFALYQEDTGGASLWIETQNVMVDAVGRFTVLLGSATTGGLPSSLFLSGDARWLGVTPENAEEMPRIMLASVPYAFEAADAQTIGGLAPGEFVTQEQFASYLGRSLRSNADNNIVSAGRVAQGEMAVESAQFRGNGGVASRYGSTSEAPLGSHTNTAPGARGSKARNAQNTQAVETGYNWSIGNIPVALTAGIQAAVTLTPCPLGVDTSGSPNLGGPNGGYPVYIADAASPANSESVSVTGGTCTSAASSGTVAFTPYFSHTMSTYSIGSSSSGIQETINIACGTNVLPFLNGGCQVVIPATGPGNYSGYDVYDTIYFHANESALNAYGATLNCHGRGPCLQVGDLLSSNDYVVNTIEGISFRSPDNHQSDPAFNGSLITSTQTAGGTITIQTAAPHNLRTGDRVVQMLTDASVYWGDVPSITVVDATHYTYLRSGATALPPQVTPGTVALSYEAVLDNAASTSLTDLQFSDTGDVGAFNHFFDLWDDENAQINGFSNNGISLNHNANWTGSFVWSGGASNLPNISQQLAPVITVNNASITANGSNCATVYNSNEFSFQNSVCQAQSPWEFLISDITGNYQGANFQNIYSESSLVLNPSSPAKSPWPGLGIAGFIGGSISGAGSYTLSGQGGFSGAMPTVGNGSTTYVYYAIARDLTARAQTSPLPFMYEQENSPSRVTVQWPRLAAGADVIVYDLVRNPAPEGVIGAAGGGYVAPYTGGCNGGSAYACGSIATGLPQCSGFVCSFVDSTANNTSSYNVANGTFSPNPTFWPGAAVLSSTPLQSSSLEILATGIAFNGAPLEYANYCNAYGVNVSGGYTVCTGSITTANNSVPDQAPLILTDGVTTDGGGVPGAKGRLIFETMANTQLNFHQVITIYDSNPAKTQATTGHRPIGDPGDMYVGIDQNHNMMLGGGVNGIAQYVNNIGNGTAEELLTSSGKLFTVPVQAPNINITQLLLNGIPGQPGQVPVATATGTVWGTCGNAAARSTLALPTGGNQPPGFQKVEPPIDFALTAGRQQVGGDVSTSSGLSGAASLSFAALANGTCQAQTFILKGVRAGEPVIAKWPIMFEGGLLGDMRASADSTIEVRVCNLSGKPLTPASHIYGALIPPN